jgi:GNAT superfamily N-acetyltransferase
MRWTLPPCGLASAGLSTPDLDETFVLHAVRVTKRSRYVLDQQTRTSDPVPPWVQEIEDYIFDVAAANVGHLSLFIAQDTNGIAIGAFEIQAADEHYDPHFHTQYLRAVLVFADHRGTGLGRELLECAITTAASVADTRYVYWLVEHDNDAMLHISSTLGPSAHHTAPDRVVTTGLPMFVVDC